MYNPIIPFPNNIYSFSHLKNILVESSHHILLNRSHKSLKCLVSLALRVIVLHVLHRGKSSLNGDVEAAVAGIGNGLADSGGDDVRLSVLDWKFNVSLHFLGYKIFSGSMRRDRVSKRTMRVQVNPQ